MEKYSGTGLILQSKGVKAQRRASKAARQKSWRRQVFLGFSHFGLGPHFSQACMHQPIQRPVSPPWIATGDAPGLFRICPQLTQPVTRNSSLSLSCAVFNMFRSVPTCQRSTISRWIWPSMPVFGPSLAPGSQALLLASRILNMVSHRPLHWQNSQKGEMAKNMGYPYWRSPTNRVGC